MKKRLLDFLMYLVNKLDTNTILLKRERTIDLQVDCKECSNIEIIEEDLSKPKIKELPEDLKDTLEVPTFNESDIEANILPLVKIINGMPGIYTTNSCGGHENPVDSQAKLNSWYVTFRIDSNIKEGFSSLSYLTYFFNSFLAGMQLKSKLEVFCNVTNNIDPVSSLICKISGEDVPLDLVEKMLEDLIKYDFDIESLEQAILKKEL